MALPQQYTAKVDSISQASPKVTKLHLSYLNPPTLEFIPGQFVNLKCPNGKFRAYSIASNSADTTFLELLIESGHDGLAANYVKSLKAGDEVTIIGPSGRFTLPETLSDHLVFFATGTGLAPFLAMFHKLVDIAYEGKVELFFGARKEDEVLEISQLQLFKQNLPNFDYKIYISDGSTQTYNQGRITQVLNSDLDKNATYFICGHPAMVADVKTTLLASQISEDNIRIEGFTHSKS